MGLQLSCLGFLRMNALKGLTGVVDDMLNGRSMPKSWKGSGLVPIYSGRVWNLVETTEA